MVVGDILQEGTTEGAGGKMVFVKVRETYDLKTVQNKMTVIGIHTPNPEIIKKNYPGLLMQCRAYRPVSCDVRLACASVLPLDPLGVGTSAGDVAPEDVFNPILYKAMSNKGMSQLEARIAAASTISGVDIKGNTADVDVDSLTSQTDEFPIYYGLLSQTHDWKHAGVQNGLTMSGLKPFVYDVLINTPDSLTPDYGGSDLTGSSTVFPGQDGSRAFTSIANNVSRIVGDAQPMPFINCTSYSLQVSSSVGTPGTFDPPGFPITSINNCEVYVPWIRAYCGAIIVPPSRLHALYFRMVVEWTIEFSKLRPIGEITDWVGLGQIGSATHYQNYSYESAKSVFTGEDQANVMDNDSCMVSTNADIDKVM